MMEDIPRVDSIEAAIEFNNGRNSDANQYRFPTDVPAPKRLKHLESVSSSINPDGNDDEDIEVDVYRKT